MTRHSLASIFLLCILAIAAARQGGPAHALTTITVTTVGDELNTDGDCSLREAIQAANLNTAVDACAAGVGADTIVLAAGTYTISRSGIDDTNANGDFDIITTNPSGERLTIQGAGAGSTRIDGGSLDRVLHVVSQLSELILIDVTVQQGQVTDVGGAGVLNWGTLRLERVVVRNNDVTGTSSDAIGGGLCNGCVTGTGQATLIDTVIENNTAQRGGGIFTNRPLTISSSSIINNTAVAGGGITNYGDLSLTNTTVSGNTGTNNTGAISQSGGALAIASSTVSHNTSPNVGGISAGSGTTTLKNTIVAQNSGSDCSGTLTSQGHNLSDDPTCAALFTASGDITTTDALLGPLQDNGGPTVTRALLPGSLAFNTGTNTGCPATDQRGIARPQARTCDIGAYEREAVLIDIYLPLVLKNTP
ncbi:MAG: CSLREA domain-containing protein [Herpetosiphonaceae bacterium]|nr:CSLREA domain-containing protein [Herpetosiphonaceae bacterium]